MIDLIVFNSLRGTGLWECDLGSGSRERDLNNDL